MAHRQTRVEIDAQTHADVFPATVPVPEVRWNGFACPSFDRETAERVIAMVTRDGEDYHVFHWDGDTLVMVSTDGSTREQDPTGEWIDVERMEGPTYSIGAWGWTWQEIDEDAPTEPEALDAWLTQRAEEGAAYAKAHNARNRERRAYIALWEAGARTIEAVCETCGETFIPADADDLTHIRDEGGNGVDCGLGRVTGGML